MYWQNILAITIPKLAVIVIVLLTLFLCMIKSIWSSYSVMCIFVNVSYNTTQLDFNNLNIIICALVTFFPNMVLPCNNSFPLLYTMYIIPSCETPVKCLDIASCLYLLMYTCINGLHVVSTQ